jgi:bifunctional non-homologous end joining protein LigD
VLGAYRSDELVYVGNVGTGFKETETASLRKTLDKLRWKQKRPPVETTDA